MKFTAVNPHNVAWLVPRWALDPFALARALEDVLVRYRDTGASFPAYKKLGFWIVVSPSNDGWNIELKESDETSSPEEPGCLFIECDDWAIGLPLNAVLRGHERLEGLHLVYQHAFAVECPLGYIGITKQRWFDRLAQHRASAAAGSPYVFHRSMRQHEDSRQIHRVLLAGVNYDTAMALEEELVGEMTLYPLGLNMIPGGRAGIRYLGSLGVFARSAKERDAAVELLAGSERVAGQPNPLCAARWQADPDYAARVICGHSGRLTVDQVQMVRRMAAIGYSSQSIAGVLNISAARIGKVVRGKTYARVS